MATKTRKPVERAVIVAKPITSMSRGVGEVQVGSRSWDKQWRAARMTVKENDEYKTRQIVLQGSDGEDVFRFTPDELDFWRDFFIRAAAVYGNGASGD